MSASGVRPFRSQWIWSLTLAEAYLHYIRRQNPVTDGAPNADQIRSVVTNAYEFALKQCGTDRESGEIWQEYTDFINEASVCPLPL
jgi:cleavage stimulation factor subunit 3